MDVDGLPPGVEAMVSDTVLGYPVAPLADIKPGDYWVQGLLPRVRDLSPRRWQNGEASRRRSRRGAAVRGGAGESVQQAGADAHRSVERRADAHRARQDDPPIPGVPDTKYVKHFRVQSERLTKFWGRPMYLGAILVLPEGFDTHPECALSARDLSRPLPAGRLGFSRDAARSRSSARDDGQHRRALPERPRGRSGARSSATSGSQQEKGYEFYKEWTGPGVPARAACSRSSIPTPYYDDSYAVNSENNGPYGDAITYELHSVHGVALSRARRVGARRVRRIDGRLGGARRAGEISRGLQRRGRELSRTRSTSARSRRSNIYRDGNAFVSEGPWRTTPRPAERDYFGRTRVTMEQSNQKELVLGTHSRSGGQWDIWEAVFSPVGADGYPQRIFDKRTGVDRHDRRGVLARQLRSRAHHAARLGDARSRSCAGRSR